MAAPNDDLIACLLQCTKSKTRAMVLSGILRSAGAKPKTPQQLKTEVDNYMKIVYELPL